MVLVKGRNCGKFDEFISVMYSAMERMLFSGINLRIFRHGANAVLRHQLENLLARCFRISFASHIKHRNALFRPRDFLRRPYGNEKSRPFPVGYDPADGKWMIQQRYLAAHLQVTRLRDDVVSDHFVRAFERPAIAEQEALAQRVEAFVIDSIHHH